MFDFGHGKIVGRSLLGGFAGFKEMKSRTLRLLVLLFEEVMQVLRLR